MIGNPHIRHIPQSKVTIEAKAFEYHVDFRILWLLKDSPEIEWQKAEDSFSPSPTKNIDEAYAHVTGAVRYDGCSNWNFAPVFHACSREELTTIGELLAQCYDWTKELCPNWNE